MSTTIRLATLSDEPAIVELNEVVQRLHASYDPSLFKQPVQDELSDWFKGFLSKANSQIWIVEDSGKAVGYACVSLQEREANPFCRNRRYLEIENICVRPNEQRCGAGRQLVEHVLRTAAEDGIGDVELSCWCFNTGAQEAFKRLGFEPRWVRFRQVVSPLPDSSAPAPKSPKE